MELIRDQIVLSGQSSIWNATRHLQLDRDHDPTLTEQDQYRLDSRRIFDTAWLWPQPPPSPLSHHFNHLPSVKSMPPTPMYPSYCRELSTSFAEFF